MQYIHTGSPSYRKALIGMLLGSTVTFATLYSPQTLIGVFAEQYHVSPSTASFTISFTTVVLAFSMLIVSLFSGSWGRKSTMSLSLVLTSVIAIISSFANNFPFLLVLRLLLGISLAGFPATAMAYLGEEFDPKSIGGIMGVYIAGCGFGAFVGRAVIGTLTDLFSWHTALLGLGAINLLFSLWFWINLPESKNLIRTKVSFSHSLRGLQTALRNRRLLILYTVGFLIMGVYIAMLNYFSLPLRKAPYHLSQTLLGLLYVVNLVGIYGSIYFGRLADRYPRKRILTIGVLLGITGATITLSNALVLKIIGLTIFVFGFNAVHTVASGWVGLTASKEHKAQASSLYLLFYYVGSSIVGWSGGLFWTWFGWNGVIEMIGGLLILTAVIVSVALNTKKPSLLGVTLKDGSASVARLSEYHKTA